MHVCVCVLLGYVDQAVHVLQPGLRTRGLGCVHHRASSHHMREGDPICVGRVYDAEA